MRLFFPLPPLPPLSSPPSSSLSVSVLIAPHLHAGQSPTHFSSLLTTLFESIALILSQHQPVVEKYYGPGKMLSVAKSLMAETDLLGLRVVANWEEERRTRKRVGEVRSWNFGGAGGGAGGGQGRREKKGSPRLSQGGFEVQGHGQNGDHGGGGGAGGEEIDPRETDAILTELSMMSGRWELLRRFLYGTLRVRFFFSTPFFLSFFRRVLTDLLSSPPPLLSSSSRLYPSD